MSKARTLADFISDGSEFADGTISVAEVSGAAPLASPAFTADASFEGGKIIINEVTGSDAYSEIRKTNGGSNFAISSPESLYLLIDSDNTQTNRAVIIGTDNTAPGSASQIAYFGESGSVFNDASYDLDFRVESDSRTHALFVDASRGQVSIGNSSWDSNLDSGVAQLLVDTGIHTEYFGEIALSYFGGTYGQYHKGLSGKYLSTGIARGLHIFNYDNDSAAGIQFWPKNKPGDTSPERGGYMGVNRNFIWEGLATFNENGGDYDFRVESDTNANALFMDASVSKVKINTTLGGVNNTLNLVVGDGLADGNTYSTGNWEKIAVFLPTDNNTGSNSGVVIGGGSYGGSGTETLRLQFANTHGNSGRPVGWNIRSYTNLDANNYDQSLVFDKVTRSASGNPTVSPVFEMNAYDTVVNQYGYDRDFRVESDTRTHAIFVNAGNDSVGLMESSPDGSYPVTIGGIGTSQLLLRSTGDSGYTQGSMVIQSGTTDNPGNRGQGVYYFNEGNDRTWYAGTLYGNGTSFGIGTITGASLASNAANNTAAVMHLHTDSTVFNEISFDRDFRIESDAEANMFVVDASNNKITIANTYLNGPLNVFNRGGAFESNGWGDTAITTYGSFGGGIALVDSQNMASTAKAYIIYTADSGNDFYIQNAPSRTSTTGGVYLNNAATSWSSASDERDKENLVNITGAVDNIKTLRAVKGNYIDQPDVDKAFLIAQDVNAFLPEAVSVRNKDAEAADQRYGLDYQQLIPVLVAAIKEQQATIEDLETRLAALESA